MAPKGTPRLVTPQNKAQKRALILEKIGEGRTFTEACAAAGVSRTTERQWRQRDERWAVAVAEAQETRRDVLVKTITDIALDETTPHRDRILALFFLIKQVDPSFRDNHKTELSVSPELASSLTKLAKLAES